MMFLEGMNKPWWLAAAVVWLVVVIGLESRGFEFLTASRIALGAGAVVGFVVWYVIKRGRDTPPSPPPKP